MDNQHRQINGYRELNQEEIDLMNRVKAKGAELEALIEEVKDFNHKLCDGGDAKPFAADAHRWAYIARNDFQTGLMALTRAVAKPTFF